MGATDPVVLQPKLFGAREPPQISQADSTGSILVTRSNLKAQVMGQAARRSWP
jgi:hypothetical protein